MMEKRLSRVLMGLGAAVGVASVVVMTLEVAINLPDWLVRIAMIKLAFIAAGGLLAAGAFLGRHAKGRELTGGPVAQLGEGDGLPTFTERRDARPADLPRKSPTPR